MTIEKQINLLLDERVKLLGLKIENPPANLVEMIEGTSPEPLAAEEEKPAPKTKGKAVPKKTARPKKEERPVVDDDDELPLITQDIIDARINAIEVEMKQDRDDTAPGKKTDENINYSDPNVKILDIALERGTLSKKTDDKEKKVRFFRENFPSE